MASPGSPATLSARLRLGTCLAHEGQPPAHCSGWVCARLLALALRWKAPGQVPQSQKSLAGLSPVSHRGTSSFAHLNPPLSLPLPLPRPLIRFLGSPPEQTNAFKSSLRACFWGPHTEAAFRTPTLLLVPSTPSLSSAARPRRKLPQLGFQRHRRPLSPHSSPPGGSKLPSLVGRGPWATGRLSMNNELASG